MDWIESQPPYRTLTETARELARGDLSPVDLTEAYLERIQQLDPLLNSFITLNAAAALEDARQAEAEIQNGVYRGPLHGIPLALKDLYETEGLRTTAGSSFFADYIPAAHGAVVERLQAAGAVLLGKLNMHEIALGVTNVNPHYGPCRNPWNPERVSGGSSGGSAVALAAGLCLGSFGTDTGGSIRIPAALCGIVGLKPTYGRISLHGVLPLSWTSDHAGPMALCVEDIAILLQVVAGYDRRDPASLDKPVDDYGLHLEEGVQDWHIALASDEYFQAADPEVLQAIAEAASVFEELGARVSRVPFPGARQAAQANSSVVTGEAAAIHKERLESQEEGFGDDVRQRLFSGAAQSITGYAQARRTQVILRREFENFFNHKFDLMITPTTPVTAPMIAGQDAIEQARRLTRFTAPFNLTGLPAISLPCGFTSEGLPVGLQIIAPPWAEANLLRAAWAYEQATSWHLQRPAIPFSPQNHE